jgi:hypothetical protein
MTYTIVCVNIRCNKLSAAVHPVYRIFLNNSLIIERRFWPDAPDYYIQEQITMTDDNDRHTITVKNVHSSRGDIYVHDVLFFDGNTRTLLNHSYETVDAGQFMFTLPKR